MFIDIVLASVILPALSYAMEVSDLLSSAVKFNNVEIPCASLKSPENGAIFHSVFTIPDDTFRADFAEPYTSFSVQILVNIEICRGQFQSMALLTMNETVFLSTNDVALNHYEIGNLTFSSDITVNMLGKYRFALVGTDFTNQLNLIDTVEVEIVRKYTFSRGSYVTMLSADGSKVSLEIGRGTYPNKVSNLFQLFHFDDYNWNVKIGAFCSIAQDFRIMLGKSSGSHNYELMSSYPFPALLTPNFVQHARTDQDMTLIIGNDVWIGMGVTIMNNVIIGDGAVIGAFSVVRENIPPYAIAVGNPAKVVKYRFDEKYINLLLDLKWWNWSDEELIDRNASFQILRKKPESFFNDPHLDSL